MPTTLHTSPEVRYREVLATGQGSPTSQNFVPNVPTVNTMAGDDIKLPIFNGNGLEGPEQH